MSMHWVGKIRKLQVDLSSYCNARCGACVRNITGGATDPALDLVHFDTNLWDRLVQDDTRTFGIEKLTFNGNWGDPCMHPKLPEMLETFTRAHPESVIFIATNGSMHNPAWWAKLAQEIRWGGHHLVQFAIDGLEDTHSVYRRKTRYDKIIENVQAFKAAGGRAEWVFTLFDHNVHQEEQVIAEARRLGFDSIKIRSSHSESMIIKDTDADYEITTKLIPEDKKHGYFRTIEFEENQAERTSNGRDKHRRLYQETEEEDESNCPWYNQGEIQIDPWGNVWPCCHVSLYGLGNGKHNVIDKKFDLEESLIKPYGRFNKLSENTLLDILEHQFYEDDIHHATEEGTWEICRDICDVPCSKAR